MCYRLNKFLGEDKRVHLLILHEVFLHCLRDGAVTCKLPQQKLEVPGVGEQNTEIKTGKNSKIILQL